MLTKTKLSSVLLSAIMSGVKAKPKYFKRFVEVLRKEGSDIFDEIAEKLESLCQKYTS